MTNVARVDRDRAGGIIITGATTVFVNNQPVAVVSSVIGTAPNRGDVIVTSTSPTVFAENRNVAPIGSVTARGFAVSSGSGDVTAG